MRRSPRAPLITSRIVDHIPRGILPRIALYALMLNALWEFGHAGLLYDMWQEVSLAKGLFHIILAILGDAVIVFGVMALACSAVGTVHVVPPNIRGWTVLIALGLAAGIVLEWFALYHNWWTYNDLMPILELWGEAVGLSPVAQITLLPALSVYLATRGLKRDGPGKRRRAPLRA